MACRAQHCVRVSLQSLDNLLALQIPDVHHLVLTARHDPLATGHREVRKDAVLLVPVSRVRLQALALRVVPQLERVVQCRRQDVLSIRRELDKAHRRVLVINQRLQALSTGRVPNPTQTIVTGTDNQGPIPVKVHRRHGIRVRRKCLQAFTRTHIPDPDRLIETAGHDQITLRIKVAAEDVVPVSLECLEQFAVVQLPDLQRLVVTGTDQQATVAAPGHITDAQFVARNRLVELAVVRSPDLDQLVGG